MLTAPNQRLGLYTKPQNSYVRTMKSDFYGAVSVLRKKRKGKERKPLSRKLGFSLVLCCWGRRERDEQCRLLFDDKIKGPTTNGVIK